MRLWLDVVATIMTDARRHLLDERELVRASIVESLKLIVQSQIVLADLEINQKRLEGLLHELEDDDG